MTRSLRRLLLAGFLTMTTVAADCHEDPVSPTESAPAVDVSGLWEFSATMPSGTMRWNLEIQMSEDGRISGTAPWGQIVNFIGGPINPRLTLQDNRPVSGRVTGSTVELSFDALDTEKPHTFKGNLTTSSQITGNDWIAERVG